MCKELGESHSPTPAELPAHVAHHATNEICFVRYKGRENPPLGIALGEMTSRETLRVGDFGLDHLVTMPVAAPAQPAAQP